MVAGRDGWGSPSMHPGAAVLGRRGRQNLSGPLVARTAGDGGYPDLGIDDDVRHGTGPNDFQHRWGHGYATVVRDDGGSSSFGGLRQAVRQFTGAWYNPGGSGGAYGGGWSDGKLIARDRHIMTRRGTTKTSSERTRDPGLPNRLADGPPLAEYQMVNTTESWQIGYDGGWTHNEDNQGLHTSVEVTGQTRRFPLGTQDGNQTLVYGPPIGEWREYGVRGVTGMHGPAPDVWDPNWIPARGTGAGGGRGRITQPGEPGTQTGDRRMVYGGVPHGLHSPTLNSQIFTKARQAVIVQQVPPRVDRPASSKAAGQSYSQSVVPQAQAGERANPPPRIPDPGRRAGVLDRFLPRR